MLNKRTLPAGHRLCLSVDGGATAEDHDGQPRREPTDAERDEAQRDDSTRVTGEMWFRYFLRRQHAQCKAVLPIAA